MTTRTRAQKKAILGKKLGMTQIFDEEGTWIPVTVLEVGPCTVLQVKTPDRDGYTAVQLGFGDRRKLARQPQQALLDRLGIRAKRFVREVPYVDPEDLIGREGEAAAPARDEEGPDAPAEPKPGPEESAGGALSDDAAPDGTASDDDAASEAGGAEEESRDTSEPEAAESTARSGVEEEASPGDATDEQPSLEPGAVLGVKALRGLKRVDVRGVTKGRGFAGTIKRYGFNAGDKSHGSKNIREPGSTGMHTDPGRVIKGRHMPGHLGAVARKVRNLEIVRIDEERNLLLLRGAVPGPRGGYVTIEESLKQS